MTAVLRDLADDDLSTVKSWRNHPDIKRFMFSQHDISTSEHRKWFTKCQQDSLQFLMMYEEDGLAKGFLQLSKKSSQSNVFEWGFYVYPEADKGTGSRMTRMGIRKAFLDLAADKIFAEVLGFNEASIKLHQKLGFETEGILKQQHWLNNKYHDVYCFGLLKRDWSN